MVLWEKQFNFRSRACGESAEKLDTSLIILPYAGGLARISLRRDEDLLGI